MEYTSLDKMPWYNECNPLVEGIGFILVEIIVAKQNTQTRVRVTIKRKENTGEGIGVDDCAKVHRALFPRLEALMSTQDVYLEVMSPGMERNVKNAAEFALFINTPIRVWSREKADWILGKVISANSVSIDIRLLENEEIVTILYNDIAKAKLLNT
ncbi:MAG: hypothetical protein BKP49_09445 [Treponema sp. CETP13]|nr:MAG: hypothetical protein BKP49_09445 [Treponema sp. CETP13]